MLETINKDCRALLKVINQVDFNLELTINIQDNVFVFVFKFTRFIPNWIDHDHVIACIEFFLFRNK